MDWVALQMGRPYSCLCRTLTGRNEAVFAFLPPGEYLLTAGRSGRMMRLLLRLPPGAYVELRCMLRAGRCWWRRDFFHYFFNAT